MKVTIQNVDGKELAVREMGENPALDFNSLPIDAALLQAAGKRISFQFAIPVLGIHGTWICDSRRPPTTFLEWNFSCKSAQQNTIPYWCGFNLEGKNVAAVAVTCPSDDVEIAGHIDQMRCVYHFTVTVAIEPETEPFELLYSNSPAPWPEVLAAWRKTVLPNGIPHFPDAAFLPVYCTWYAVHAALTGEYLDRNAELAAQMGFGTFIVDDGWSYDRMRRVCPEEMALGWYRCIGNWTVSEKKLPDFKKHVAYAHRLGLKYLLWTAPLLAGLDSAEYREANRDREHEILYNLWDEAGVLAPTGKTAAHAIELCKQLMDTFDLDGLKLDFLGDIPCDVQRPHSRQSKYFFQALSSRLRDGKPDALLELVQTYATPQMLAFGTQFRAGDVPFDFLTNFQRILQIRMVLGDHVPVHADPIYFHPQESVQNVSRHMIAALAGVPMLSMELRELSAEHKRVIENWLNFYRKHLELYKRGHWSISFDRGEPEYAVAEDARTAIAIVTTAGAAAKMAARFDGKELILLNLGREPMPLTKGQAFDETGNPVSGEAAPAAGRIERMN